MKTEIVNITPKMAREMLKSNTDNRRLRRGRVDEFHNLYACGEYRLTHQGIAFDSSGVLKDGQHRLVFISELPETAAVPMLVTWGLDTETFGAIDRPSKRNPADEMKISNNLAAVAGLFAKVYNSNQHFGFSINYLERFVAFAEPHFTELHRFCSKHVKVWSSSPVVAAAIYRMASGHDADFIKVQYRALVHADFGAMSPTAQSLYRQYISGKAGSGRGLDMFCRALRVFDSFSPAATRIQINSVSASTQEVRDFLQATIKAPKLKKKDTRRGVSKVAKPVADSIAAHFMS